MGSWQKKKLVQNLHKLLTTENLSISFRTKIIRVTSTDWWRKRLKQNIRIEATCQNVLMKDAAQKTLHESVKFSHIYWLFHWKKLEKQVLSKSQFFSATGDILEMQPVVFMNWCDSNARASKKNKPTGHRSLPHGEQVDGLFSSPMVLMLLLLRLCVIPWWYW